MWSGGHRCAMSHFAYRAIARKQLPAIDDGVRARFLGIGSLFRATGLRLGITRLANLCDWCGCIRIFMVVRGILLALYSVLSVEDNALPAYK